MFKKTLNVPIALQVVEGSKNVIDDYVCIFHANIDYSKDLHVNFSLDVAMNI
jgi:hypothetical protein